MSGYMDRFSARLKTIAPLEKRIHEDMLAKHHVAEGCWGIPEDAKATFSRAEFYGKALEVGACTKDEYDQIHRVLGIIWHRDLSD